MLISFSSASTTFFLIRQLLEIAFSINGLLSLNPDYVSKIISSNTTATNSTNSTSSNSSSIFNNDIATNAPRKLDEVIDENTFLKYLPIIIGIINGLQIEIINWLYPKIAKILNDWENHEKQSQYENNYILKIIVFKSLPKR